MNISLPLLGITKSVVSPLFFAFQIIGGFALVVQHNPLMFILACRMQIMPPLPNLLPPAPNQAPAQAPARILAPIPAVTAPLLQIRMPSQLPIAIPLMC